MLVGCDFSGKIALGIFLVLDREQGLAGGSIKNVNKSLLAGLHYRINILAIVLQLGDDGRRREVAVPNIVTYSLEVPDTLAGFGIKRDQRVSEKVVTDAIAAVEIECGGSGGAGGADRVCPAGDGEGADAAEGVPGSPGRILLDRRKFVIHGRARPVDAQIERFDFSSHGGKRELEMTLSDLDKKTKVFIVHGAEGNCRKLAEWANKELGLDAIAPKTGDVHEI